jgi:succinyl-diaminopimelate desuccinylase
LNFLENCRRFIGLDSTPSHGNSAAAEFAGDLCTRAGLHVEYQRESVEGVEQCNVIARPQPGPAAAEILFQTHLDTCEPGHFGHWTKTQSNPFNASIYQDVMYGLGSADSKLDFLCKLEALKDLVGRPLRTPFVLVGTFGAQSGMAGAIKLIRRKKLNAVRAFIGEPTEMRLVTACQGLAVVEISIPFSEEERAYRRDHDLMESSSTQSKMFAGRAAHSSGPQMGDNAIMKMLAYLAQLPEGIAVMDLSGGVSHNSVPASAVLEIDTVAGFHDPILPKISKIFSSLLELESDLKSFREEGFEPPHPTMNLGVVRTSEAEVRITGSCRLPPSVTDSVYEGWMRKLQKAVQAAGATFCVKGYLKGFTTPPDGEFLRSTQAILNEMNLDARPHKISGTTEASVISRSGMECVVWGPGQSVGNSHGPNEHIKLNDLKTAVAVYRRLAERFCL